MISTATQLKAKVRNSTDRKGIEIPADKSYSVKGFTGMEELKAALEV